MRKLLSLSIMGAMFFGFTGCSSDKEADGVKTGESVSETAFPMDRHIDGVLPEFSKVYQTVEQLRGDSDVVVRGVVQHRDFYKEDVASEVKVTEVIFGNGKVSVGEVVPFVAPYVLDTLKSDDEVVLFGNLHAKDDRIQRDYYESVGAFQGQFLVRGNKVKRLTDTLKSKVDREVFSTLEMGVTNLSVRVQMK